jgi:hypothetical protein
LFVSSRHCGTTAHRPALILLFAKKFFRGPSRTGTYQRFGFAARTRTQLSLSGSSVTLANEVECGRMFWLLAFGEVDKFLVIVHKRNRPFRTINHQLPTNLPLLPAFTPECFRGLAVGSRIQLQQRNCSRFSRDFSRRSTFSSSQRTTLKISRLRFTAQDLFGLRNRLD